MTAPGSSRPTPSRQPRPPLIDTHHHLWDLRRLRYDWLAEPGLPSQTALLGDYSGIRRTFDISELVAEFERAHVIASVHVEAAVAPGDSSAETEWLQGIADEHAYPHALVVACDLTASDVGLRLESHTAFRDVRGIRQRDRRVDPESQAFHRGLAVLHSLGLSFEVNVPVDQLGWFERCARRHPDTMFVLGHAGQPSERTREGLQRWRSAIRRFAENPNTVVKISGLPMFDHDWTRSSLREIAVAVIETFGPDRCMFGSNWPVDSLFSTYVDLIDAYVAVASEFGTADRDAMLVENARRVYRIALDRDVRLGWQGASV